MTVIRGPRPDRGYLTISNDVARDRRLSFRARGVLVEMLSHADNWRTSIERLADASPKEGRDAVRGALQELVDAGYATFVRRNDPKNGRLVQEWIVTDAPGQVTASDSASSQVTPLTGLPLTGEPLSAQPLSANPVAIEEGPKDERPIEERSTPTSALAALDAKAVAASELNARARAIVQRAWDTRKAEGRTPAGANAWHVGIATAKAFLNAGRSEPDVEAAMISSGLWSIGAVTLQLDRMNGRGRPQSNSDRARSAIDRVVGLA